MFFYANRTTSIDEADFWEKSYLFRQVQCPELDSETSAPFSSYGHGIVTNEKREVGQRESIVISSSKGKERSNMDRQACPLFIKDIAKAIVSAGKSLQLIRHIPVTSSGIAGRGYDVDDGYGNSKEGFCHGQSIAGLTLSEVFCVSLSGLIGHGDHIFRYLCQDDWYKTNIVKSFELCLKKEKIESNECEILPMACSEKLWYKYLVDTLFAKKLIDVRFAYKDGTSQAGTSEDNIPEADANRLHLLRSFCPENPTITVVQGFLSRNRDAWKALNLSRNFYLPPLNDEGLRKAIFGEEDGTFSAMEGTDYSLGFQFGESEYLRSKDDSKMLEMLFPFPTVLPSSQVLFFVQELYELFLLPLFEASIGFLWWIFIIIFISFWKQDGSRLSELLPFQKNSTLPSRVLSWIQNFEPKNNLLPVVIMQECLTVYIKKQVKSGTLTWSVVPFVLSMLFIWLKFTSVVGGLYRPAYIVKINERLEINGGACCVACHLLIRIRYLLS